MRLITIFAVLLGTIGCAGGETRSRESVEQVAEALLQRVKSSVSSDVDWVDAGLGSQVCERSDKIQINVGSSGTVAPGRVRSSIREMWRDLSEAGFLADVLVLDGQDPNVTAEWKGYAASIVGVVLDGSISVEVTSPCVDPEQ